MMTQWIYGIPKYLINIFCCVILGVFCLKAEGSEPAGRAIVKTDSLTVYSRMSTESSIVKTLNKGDVIAIEFEIEGPEGAWCSITEEDQTVSSGNVLCKYLERKEPPIRWERAGRPSPEEPLTALPMPAPHEQQAKWSELIEKAVTLYQQEKYSEAIKVSEEALKVAKETLDTEHPNVVTSLNNLALIYKALGKNVEGEPLYNQALKISERVLGPNHPDVATSLNNLAEVYVAQDKYAKAEPLYKRALEMSERTLGPNHPDLARPLNNLADIYKAQGRYEEAEPLYERVLKISKEVVGPIYPDLAQPLSNLAELYTARGKYDKAERLYKQALEMRKRALGPDHPDVVKSINNLAELYTVRGKYDNAERLYKQALAIREKILGPDHPQVATVLENLAELYRRWADTRPFSHIRPWEKRDKAEKLEERAKRIRSQNP
jgi:tetratricopeptide (TPR) repeat protein